MAGALQGAFAAHGRETGGHAARLGSSWYRRATTVRAASGTPFKLSNTASKYVCLHILKKIKLKHACRNRNINTLPSQEKLCTKTTQRRHTLSQNFQDSTAFEDNFCYFPPHTRAQILLPRKRYVCLMTELQRDRFLPLLLGLSMIFSLNFSAASECASEM